MKKECIHLGEFEHLVLLTIIQLKNDAYGLSIRHKLNNMINRSVTVGALYSTTDRLEKKGLIYSQKGETTPERGGKAKRYFYITESGIEKLRQTKNQLNIMWDQLKFSSLSLYYV